MTASAVAACAVLGSLASREVSSSWYRALRKPPIQPPKQVFPIAWTVLYADIAATSAVALDRLGQRDPAAVRAYVRALGINLVLNTGWSWSFFKLRRLGAATAVAAALTLSSADLVRRTGLAQWSTGVALAPYAGWCAFATVLSGAIWRRNR